MPATRSQIWDSTNKIKSHTTTERNALIVSDGIMVYNSEDDEMQGYDSSTSGWVSLTLPDGLCPDAPAVAEHTHDGYAAVDHTHMASPPAVHSHAGLLTIFETPAQHGGYVDFTDPTETSLGHNARFPHTLGRVPTLLLGLKLARIGTGTVDGYAAGSEINLFGNLDYKIEYTDTAKTVHTGEFRAWIYDLSATHVRSHIVGPTVPLPNSSKYVYIGLGGNWGIKFVLGAVSSS